MRTLKSVYKKINKNYKNIEIDFDDKKDKLIIKRDKLKIEADSEMVELFKNNKSVSQYHPKDYDDLYGCISLYLNDSESVENLVKKDSFKQFLITFIICFIFVLISNVFSNQNNAFIYIGIFGIIALLLVLYLILIRIMKKFNITKKKILIFIGILIILLMGGCFLYLNDYYHADLESISVISYPDDINKDVLSDNTIVYSRDNSTTGIIFYPGAKVEYLAYEPLLIECSKYGYLCAVVDMPFNLAILDIDAANDVIKEYPNIDNWYIGGHSLGGAMASSYASDNTDNLSGLILLGAYSTKDLSDSSLNVISIYGSEDKVLNMDKYNKYKSNLPKSFREEIITGGCHSYFGMYGEQSGDGKCLIKNTEQISKTMEIISKFVG